MPPCLQSTCRGRRRTLGHSRCAAIELEERLRRDGAESGVGARASHPEVAHLLEVIEGVGAVLRTSCHDAWSTHLRAGAAQTVGSRRLVLEIPLVPICGMHDEGAICREHIDEGPGAWSVSQSSAPLVPASPCDLVKLVDLFLARPALSVVQRIKSAAAAAPLHAYCSGDARRLMRWRAPHRRSGEAA